MMRLKDNLQKWELNYRKYLKAENERKIFEKGEKMNTKNHPSGWQETTLGEIIYPVSETFKFQNKQRVHFLNTGDILAGKLLHNDLIEISTLPGQAKKKFRKGDILYSEIRPANKRFMFVDFDSTNSVASTKLMVLRGKENIDTKFLYQFLTAESTIKEFQFIAESRSGTFPQITFDAISYFPLLLPPLKEQIAITAVLSSLDEKIELLQQENKTLENMAQALFKRWFIDFEFPNSPLEGYGDSRGVESLPQSVIDDAPEDPPRQAAPATPQEGNRALFPYWKLPRNQKLRERARGLRKQGILSEVVFWQKFKDKRTLGWDIDRQVIIDNFIVDFFIPELGLVFEIDGASHNEKQGYDQERDAVLEGLGLKVVRILDTEVLKNINGVWEFVNEKINERVAHLSKNSPLEGWQAQPDGVDCSPLEGCPEGGVDSHGGIRSTPRLSPYPSRGEFLKAGEWGLGYKASGGKMIDSELGEIPEGWSVGSVLELANIIGGGTPQTNIAEYWNGDILWLSGKDVTENNGEFVLKTEKTITQKGIKNSSTRLLPRFATIISARGTVGSICLTFEPMCMSQTSYALVSKENTPFFIYFFLMHLLENLKANSYGAIFDTITTNTFYSIIIPLPPDVLSCEFEKIIQPILMKKLKNTQEIQTLTSLRDTLLPKLMKGEIRV